MTFVEPPALFSLTPLEHLQLSPGPLRALHQRGIATVGELWATFTGDPDLAGIGGLGRRGAAEVRGRLIAFRSHIAQTSPDQLEGFPDPRPLLVEVGDPSPNLLLLLPAISEALSRIHDAPRGYEFLRRRYGFGGSAAYTLEEIGSYYGLTRERVRQVEEQAKRRLALVLRGQDGVAAHRLPDAMLREFQELHTWARSGPALVRESEVVRQLALRYSSTLQGDERAAVPLLMELLDGTSVRAAAVGLRDSAGTVWNFDPAVDLKRIAAVVQGVRKQLEDVIRPDSLFHLTVSLNRVLKSRVSADDVRLGISLLEEIEQVGPDEYQWRFDRLKSIGDKAYAVLAAEGKPLHFQQIARGINQRMSAAGAQALPSLHHNLGSLLSTDDRFEAVARSGSWKLREWAHVRTDSIVDLMQEALAARQEPLTYDEIHEYVGRHRPDVPRQSILSLVALNSDLFVRHSRGKVELAAWGGSPSPLAGPRREREAVRRQVRDAVREIVSESGAELTLAGLVREIRSRTGLPENTVRSRLAKASWAEVTNQEGPRVVRIHVDALERETAAPPRAPIRSEVERLVNQYLNAQPEGRASIIEIWKHIRQLRTRIKRPTLYAVLGKMTGLRKEHLDRRVTYALESFRRDKALELPRLDAVRDDRLKSDLQTAQSNLTLSNIDAGLFQLGKILEGELKRLLTKAQAAGTFPVSNRDLSTLNNMMECVVKNGVIRSGHHLTLLREQRNARAHGAIPSDKEREELMSHAPFVIDLYMQYITSISEARLKLG